ncbi:hypothetical protein [Clostridium ganghwense]|uniref:Lipoprotein n=1 Tax=Clostridium ganghwense TaxID=312089 RepID=A0ABT4CJT9_9CLOT|nr:hypothetical protein [Clostridium ganghwense]MCY6369325.1 hypothetical protein [Clostridium ganghwense]
MNKKVISICCAVCIGSILFSGCCNSLQDEKNKLTKEITLLKEKNSELNNKFNKLEAESKILNARLKEQVSIISAMNNKNSKNKFTVFTVYTANVDTCAKEIGFYINISEDVPLIDKLNIIADKLSKSYFGGLPIEALKIEEKQGKKIAIINLKEFAENQGITDSSKLKGKTWRTQSFQGSTGGSITSTTLIETFLQREYEGEWIDGVKFLYNHEDVDFMHVPKLYEVNFRK